MPLESTASTSHRITAGTAVIALVAATGCGARNGEAAAVEPSASTSPQPVASGVLPVPSPTELEGAEPVEPLPLPDSCEAAGLKEQMGEFADRLAEPEFEEVRTDSRLECSWAGFSAEDWSEVVMVTYAPGGSLVDYPGHVPAETSGDPSFFTTPEVSGLGGLGQWRTGEVFSGVSLHLPGLLVTLTDNSERIGDDDLLDVAVATADEVLAGADGAAVEPPPSGGEPSGG